MKEIFSVPEELKKGLILHHDNRLKEAGFIYRNFIAQNPNNSFALTLYGTLLIQVKKNDEAIKCLLKSISLDPQNPLTHCNYGVALFNKKKFFNANNSFFKAISLKDDYHEAIHFSAKCFLSLKEYEKAYEYLTMAIKIENTYLPAYKDLASLYKIKNETEFALNIYNKIISINPTDIEAYINKGEILYTLDRFEDEFTNYQQALFAGIDEKFLLGKILRVLMYLSKWDNFYIIKNKIQALINKNEFCITPMMSLIIFDDLNIHKSVSKLFTRKYYPKENNFSFKKSNSERVRIAFYSSDFFDHATMHLLSDTIKFFDRSKFHYIAFSFGKNKNDYFFNEAKKNFETFIDVSLYSDDEVVEISRKLCLDIAIDLKGFTSGNRTAIFAKRLARIQISYLGFPGTMGNNYIDYLIADKIIIPYENQKFFSEKILYLPNSYQPNCKINFNKTIKNNRFDFGLPEKKFIFCSFNSNHKITPDIFSLWMKILKKTKDSVLWLLVSNEKARQNIIGEVIKAKIDIKRIFFASPISLDEHIRRITCADLFLDTFPYNAHTTASDALRSGLPILTRAGKSFASRVSASLLSQLNMTELVTNSETEYFNLAVRLASSKYHYEILKQKLHENLMKSDLFNPEVYCKDLELLFKRVHDL